MTLAAGLLLAGSGVAAEGGDEWGYEGAIAPANWARLKWEWALCELGVHQSPIDLSDANEVLFTDLEVFAGAVDMDVKRRIEVLDVLDNGHTVQYTPTANISLDVDGEVYELLQFHFHAPSEHTIEGRRFPLESHFVMGSEEGHLLVIGYVFEEGAANPDFEPVIEALPKGLGDSRRAQGDFQVQDIKPLQERFYAYPGSLTTPPCSEGVRWLVSAEPLQMSAQQLAAFDAVLHDNNRPIQPRHVRVVLLVEPEG